MSFYETFKSPDARYRGKPFWSWNGELKPDEIRRQVRIFKRMGMGGAFLHSRVGLATEYLGEAWFEAIRAAVDECRLEGMEAWLYDEDCWPSGYAGGLVTQNPEHRMRFLVMEIVPAKGFSYEEEDEYPVYEADVTGDKASNVQWLHPGQKPTASHVLLFHEETQPCTNYYNGFTYLDTLSEEAVAAFIDATHERYRREIGDAFGEAVPGIFTDEPNFCAFYGEQVPQGRKGIPYSYVPWTKKLPGVFETLYNYSIRSFLPELMLEVDGVRVSRARLDFRNCLTHLFTTNFFKQIYDWCERHHIKLTGHVLLEDRLSMQTLVVGAAMRAYEYMQVPGIDLLTQYAYDYDTPKQCQSVANQMGRPWMLSELYGCTGWDFSFAGHKAVGDWQTALGVTLRCHHLSWYTMKGEAKRDYPASIFFQSPWWEHYKHLEDYYARLNVALTRGRCVQDVLVVHPIESTFARFRPRMLEHDDPQKFMLFHTSEDVLFCDEALISLRNMLLENHFDFAYGDEEMMSRLGDVVVDDQGVRLRLGECEYKTVLVPPMDTIRQSTLDLLIRFRKLGGLIVFVGDFADHLDGCPSEAASILALQCLRAPLEKEPLGEILEPFARRVSIQDGNGAQIPTVLYQQRCDGDAHILFMCNTDRARGYDAVEVRLKADGKVVEHDPLTGERRLIPSRKAGFWTVFNTALEPIGSRLFVIEPSPAGRIQRAAALTQVRKQKLSDKALHAAQRTEPNVCVLDYAAYRIGEKGGFRAPTEILRIDRAVRDAMGLPRRGGEMMQPWAQEIGPDAPRRLVTLRFSFDATELPGGPLCLALETPRRYVITLNGHEVATDAEAGWWVDPAIRIIPLDSSALKKGKNALEATLDFRCDDNLEAMYLLGEFGVKPGKKNCAITPLPTLGVGDWRTQGLPFYGGAVVYRYKTTLTPKKGERVFLSAPDFEGAAIHVLVNGNDAGYLSWPPYALDITSHLGEPPAEITLTLFGSRRNCFGPLHQKTETPHAVGPGNFVTEGKDWTDDYALRPCGLLAHPILKVMARK